MNGELKIYDKEADLFAAAAATFVETARTVLAVRPQFTVALAGGSTPRAMFERLAAPPLRDEVDWRKIQWFWGDERNVPADHADSNFRMARDSLLTRVDVDPEKIHRLQGEADPLCNAAADYQRQLAQVCGVPVDGPPPSLDLVLLGMGNDGHTASLFPNTAALQEREKWVVANEVPQQYTRRLTMTYPILNAAGTVMFLAAGAGKARILREVRHGPHDPQKLPTQGIAPTSGRLWWFVDRAAASQLE
jgi:6-phosphogluconolactonase